MQEKKYYLDELEAIYASYHDDVNEAIKNSKPGAGIFGLIPGPKDDKCHSVFIKRLHEWIVNVTMSTPDSRLANEILSYIISAQNEEKTGFVYWTLIAAHGEGIPLITFLNKDEASSLLDQYNHQIPSNQRLPVQEQFAKKLEEKAERVSKKRGLFFWKKS